MDYGKASWFLLLAVVNGVIADVLAHRNKKGWFILLHCFIYTVLLLPLFQCMKVNLVWLIFIFFSHLIIDSSWESLVKFIKGYVLKEERRENKTDSLVILFNTYFEQALHVIPFAVTAYFTFIL